MQLSYEFVDKENKLPVGAGETARFHDFSFEIKYNRTAKSRFLLNLSFIDIAYVGERNTPIEFAILESLENVLVLEAGDAIKVQSNIANSLDVILSYLEQT